ncbi:unnamed protein product, partial [Nesidiocoris tenuis]
IQAILRNPRALPFAKTIPSNPWRSQEIPERIFRKRLSFPSESSRAQLTEFLQDASIERFMEIPNGTPKYYHIILMYACELARVSSERAE